MYTRSLIFGVVLWVSIGFCARGQVMRGGMAPDMQGMAQVDQFGDLKTQMEATDEEWNVLRPKIEAVVNAKTDLNGGMMGRGMRMGRQGGSESELAKQRRELLEMLMNPNMLPVDFAAKIRLVREARKEAIAKVNTAEMALVDVLTPKQEAILIQRGILD